MAEESQSYVPPILYCASDCEECQTVVAFLQRHNIQGVELADVLEEDNAQEVVAVSGQESLPVFYFNGKFAIGADQCISMVSNLVLNGGNMA